MRKGAAIAVAVAAFLVITSVLVYAGRDDGQRSGAVAADEAALPGAAGDVGGTSSDEPGGNATDAASSEDATSRARAGSNVPRTRLAPGEKPPQFVIFSIDGAGSHDVWQQFITAADAADARFTAFVTGTYLIDNAHAATYSSPGESSTPVRGFGGSKDDVLTEVADLNAAWLAGHEIGSYYNDHRCSGPTPAGTGWTAADWTAELDQFMLFVDTWADIGGYADAEPLAFDSTDIVGGRTPCVQNNLAVLGAAWAKHRFRYDASANLYTGIGWPERLDDGVWEFQIPNVYSPTFDANLLMTDGSILARFGDAANDSGAAARLASVLRKNYDHWFDAVFEGNRAPLTINTHSNVVGAEWFVPPTVEFLTDVCVRDEVICASYADVVDWLELQNPEVLTALQSRGVVAAGP